MPLHGNGMHYEDVRDDRSGAWQGLLLRGDAGRWPRLQMQAGPGQRMRLVLDGEPLLWARTFDDYYGYSLVRAPTARTRSPLVVPHLGFAPVRALRDAPGSPEWLRHWSVVIVRSLLASKPRGLGRGPAFVGPCEAFLDGPSWRTGTRLQVPPVGYLARALEHPVHEEVDWDHDDPPLLGLRVPSPPDDGRVKALRKLAREGCLPPIVVAWVSGLMRYVLIDGHDRLQAARSENVTPHCIAVLELSPAPRPLEGTRAATAQAVEAQLARALDEPPRPGRRPMSIADANRLLVDVFDTRDAYRVRTRARPLEGGVEGWNREARAALAHHRVEDPSLVR